MRMIDPASINNLTASAIMEELHRLGFSRVIISPGSRSTPLTVAAARHPDLATTIHVDERGASFCALGYARATGRPAPLICTSGTAVANYLPAVVEAWLENIPMLLLTADRPPELQNCGANQTIHQHGIFSHYTVSNESLTCPSPESDPLEAVAMIDRAVSSATGNSHNGGPVHVNCPFREPLVPDTTTPIDIPPNMHTWYESSSVLIPREKPRLPRMPSLDGLITKMAAAKRPLIIAGRLSSDTDRQAVTRLADRTGWPLFADIRSGLRLGGEYRSVIPHYDLLLLNESFADRNQPDLVLHFGGNVTSKRLLEWLAVASPETYMHIDPGPHTFDPNHQVTDRLHIPIVHAVDRLLTSVKPSGESESIHTWRKASDKVEEIISACPTDSTVLTDLQAMLAVTTAMQNNNHDLFVASSTPIRLVDWFGSSHGRAITVQSNRGASGIDGTIATAVGYALGSDRPLTLIIGDLAFLHDLNSLALLRSSACPITIVLLNNNGGGIFSLLPIARQEDIFEEFFATSHGLTFEQSAGQFAIPYRQCRTSKDLLSAYKSVDNSGEPSIIEVTTDRLAGADELRTLADRIRQLHID